jgi:LAO/AO transport system kinase
MVDFFLLLLLPGAGDELQGIKKGIMEMANLVLVNKADGENHIHAEHARTAHDAALHYQQPATPGWKTPVSLVSGLTGAGVPEVWECIVNFYAELEPKGIIARRRQQQTLDWLGDLIHEELRRQFYQDPSVKAQLPELREQLLRGEITAVLAAKLLLKLHGATKNVESTKNNL